jgi:hypothetical protein
MKTSGALKECSKCKEIKLVCHFYWHSKTGDYRSQCKDCWSQRASGYFKANREKVLASNKKWREIPENKDRMNARVRAWHYETTYGISEDEKIAILTSQGGECAICFTDLTQLKHNKVNVDHCHKTGMVRGILCHNCNHVLGHARDNPEILDSAIRYLVEKKDVLAEIRKPLESQ